MQIQILLNDAVNLFDEYSLDLGRQCLSYIEMGSFSKFDPIVSEWGCQLRALYLTKLIGDALKCGSFSDKLLKLLGYARFLTESAAQEVNYFNAQKCSGLTIHAKTAESKFTSSFSTFLDQTVPNAIISNAVISKLYANVKSQLASDQLQILVDLLGTHQPYLHADARILKELLLRLQKPYYVNCTRTHIPCLPSFDTMVLFNELVTAMKLDVVVRLWRVKRKPGMTRNESVERALLCYRADDEGKLVYGGAPVDSSSRTPVVLVEMYSTVMEGFDCSGDPQYSFHTLTNFDAFLAALVEQVDLKDHLLQFLAVHPQFTQERPIKEHAKQSEWTLNNLYEHYRTKGNSNRVGTEIYSPVNGVPYETTIPLNALHFRVSSLAELLTADAKNLSV